ncbi:MAG: MBL fold metallo-hydrolase, partial [Candidatus Omnitrophota bacterium]
MSMMNRQLAGGDEHQFPGIFLTPADSEWIGEDGSNQIQFYFAIAANWFFHHRKTKIIVKTQEEKDRIFRYLQLGNPYELPRVAGYEYSDDMYRRFRREAIALADRSSVDGRLQMIRPEEHMVEFVMMREGIANIGGVSIAFDKSASAYAVTEGGHRVVLQASHLRAMDVKLDSVKPLEDKPEFGLTILGSSSAMDINGLPSGQIVWAAKKGILFDAGAPTVALLRSLGIAPQNIRQFAITHMHEDHVAGALEFLRWMRDANQKIELIMEPGIYRYFKEQMEVVLNDSLESVFPNVQFIPSKFYEEVVLGEGVDRVRLTAIPAFHGTPTASYRIDFRGQTISLSSDTTMAPQRLAAFSTRQLPGIRKEVVADLQRLTDYPDRESVFNGRRAAEIRNALFAANVWGKKPLRVVFETGYGSATTPGDLTNHTYAGDLQTYSLEDQNIIVTNHAPGLPAGKTFLFSHATAMSTIVLPLDLMESGTPAESGARLSLSSRTTSVSEQVLRGSLVDRDAYRPPATAGPLQDAARSVRNIDQFRSNQLTASEVKTAYLRTEPFVNIVGARLTLDLWRTSRGGSLDSDTQQTLTRLLAANENFKDGRWFIEVQGVNGTSVVAYLSGSVQRDAQGAVQGGIVRIYSPDDRNNADAQPIDQFALPATLFASMNPEKTQVVTARVADNTSEAAVTAMSLDRFAARMFEQKLLQMSDSQIMALEPMVLVSYIDHLGGTADEERLGESLLAQQLASMARIKRVLEQRVAAAPELAAQIRSLVRFEFRDGLNKVMAQWSDPQTETVKRRMVVTPFNADRVSVGQGFFGTADVERANDGYNFVPILSVHIASIMIQWENAPDKPSDVLLQLLRRLLKADVPSDAVGRFRNVTEKSELALLFYSSNIARAIERLPIAQYLRVAEMVIRAVGAAA